MNANVPTRFSLIRFGNHFPRRSQEHTLLIFLGRSPEHDITVILFKFSPLIEGPLGENGSFVFD